MFHSSDQRQEWGVLFQSKGTGVSWYLIRVAQEGFEGLKPCLSWLPVPHYAPRNPYSGIYSSEPQCQIVPLSLRHKHKSLKPGVRGGIILSERHLCRQSMSVMRAVGLSESCHHHQDFLANLWTVLVCRKRFIGAMNNWRLTDISFLDWELQP